MLAEFDREAHEMLPLGRPTHGGQDNIKIIFSKTDCQNVNWIYLA
jgi:hypothetical protein